MHSSVIIKAMFSLLSPPGARRVGQQKHGFHLGAQLAVHGRHLGFVIKVRQVANAAHHGRSLLRRAKVHDQAVKRQHGHTGNAPCFGLHLRHAGLQRKQGFLVVGRGHGDDDLVKQPGRAAHHVAMAQCKRVKSAGIDSDARGGHAGIMPAPPLQPAHWPLVTTRQARRLRGR
jgi:hypothetical protein